jgi:microsomal dipeptidase-like Zn-dependent dipeptidase
LWNRDLNDRGNRGHADMPRLLEGNVALQVFTAVTKSPAGQNYDANAADTANAANIIIPLIVSHTGLRSTCDAHRNFPVDLMQAIVGNGADQGGGVIGIGYWADVTCDDSPDGVARVIMAANDVLGSDYGGSATVGFDTSKLSALTDALLRAGATEAQVRPVMGGNMLRVLRVRLE